MGFVPCGVKGDRPMTDDGKKLGSAYFEIKAKVESAEEALERVKSKGQETSEALDKSATEMGQAIDKASDSIETSSGKATDALEQTTNAAKETATEVGAAVGETATQVEQSTETVVRSNEKASRSIREAAIETSKSIRSQIAAFTGLVASITAVVGVATLFYNIGRRVGSMLFDTRTETEKYRDELEKLPEAYQRAQAAANKYVTSVGTESQEVRRAIEGITIATGLSLEEAIARADQITDKYSEIASKQAQLVTDANGVTRLEILSTQRTIERFATDSERQLTGLVYNFRRRREEAVAEAKSRELTDAVAKSLADQVNAVEDANRRAKTLIAETAGAFGVAPKDEIQAIYDELDRRIQLLNEAMIGADETVRTALDQAKRRAIEDADTLADRIERERDAAREKAIQDEIDQIRRETLTPLQAEIEATQQRQEEVRKLLGDGIDDTRQAQLLELLTEKVERLIQQQQQSDKELPEKLEQAVRKGTKDALDNLGLRSVARTLAGIYADQRRLLNETKRRAK